MSSVTNSQEWIPFALTLVKYPKDDMFGYLMALFSLAPIGIVVSYITLSLFRRDLQIMFMGIGQVINEIICLVLKKYFKQSRPSHHDLYEHQSMSQHKNYGMPSQHSQFLAYFTLYSILIVTCIFHRKPLSFKLFYVSSLLSLCSIVVYSRIYLLYHFWYQCAVGVVVGCLWAMVWFQIVYGLLEKHFFDWIVSFKIAKYFEIVNDDVRKRLKCKKK